ncbi:hypothetical protein ATANTOWER_017219 [Ataeniobius toweri]|uniref:Uncharacterized protein n=1 Tax=Ataeniobius toweri TaxID=208326 RepID=A0ABU7BA47_9TELE|nr:hypothetical protein [Ataeniobius toweri]
MSSDRKELQSAVTTPLKGLGAPRSSPVYPNNPFAFSPSLPWLRSYKTPFEEAGWYQQPKGLRLVVSHTAGTTEWFHLQKTDRKKNVCHTLALLQGDECEMRTRLLLCDTSQARKSGCFLFFSLYF